MVMSIDARIRAGDDHDAESSTRIVAVINRLAAMISLQDSAAPDQPVTIRPGRAGGCRLSLDQPGDADGATTRHIEVRIAGPGAREARFWLWQADGTIRYSRRRPHDVDAPAVPGNALTGGDRVLTIEDRAHPATGLWAALRRRLRRVAGQRQTASAGRRRPGRRG